MNYIHVMNGLRIDTLTHCTALRIDCVFTNRNMLHNNRPQGMREEGFLEERGCKIKLENKVLTKNILIVMHGWYLDPIIPCAIIIPCAFSSQPWFPVLDTSFKDWELTRTAQDRIRIRST